MRDSEQQARNAVTGLHGRAPALQVICLGSSGGPCEENVTGFLVRAVASGWSRGSLLAVDAGSHMAPIVRILERDFPSISPVYNRTPTEKPATVPQDISMAAYVQPELTLSRASSVESDVPPKPPVTTLDTGPFAGFSFPNRSARANALHLLRSYISTYLITHPHLDHLSGFVINTAAFHATSRPKTLAALPGTVDAVKKHIFNDVIWPNLTDEDGGVGFVTFQRLKEGGDVMLGEGEGRGYIDVCDGLGVKAFKVSHGLCTKSPPSHIHRGSLSGMEGLPLPNGEPMPQGRSLSLSQQQYSTPGTPVGNTSRPSHFHGHPSPRTSIPQQEHCVVDSTMFFIRDSETDREVLIFGDVEPDSISLSPRNNIVWQEAARKIAQNLLGGIFIESSYDNSQADAILFGHLNPRHLVAELQTLAVLVNEAKAARLAEKIARKRKRAGQTSMDGLHSAPQDGERHKRSRSFAPVDFSPETRRSSLTDHNLPNLPEQVPFHSHPDSQLLEPVSPLAQPHRQPALPTHLALSLPATQVPFHKDLPLAGIKVVIIHVKDTMTDGPHITETVLAELQAHEQQLRADGQGLGCEFVMAQSGESYWF